MKTTDTVIVTGGGGFIGSKLVEKLIISGKKVIVIDNFSTGKIKNLSKVISEIELINEDIGNFSLQSRLKKYKNSVQKFFHLAALPRIERSITETKETHSSNVHGIFGALELAKFLGVKKFIYTSSSSVYGNQKKNPLNENLKPNPLNPYAAQKLIGEMYCDIYSKVFGIPVVTLRLFNVYGHGMDGKGAYKLVFMKWIEQMNKKEPLTIYDDGKQTRDFTHITDVISAFLKAMEFKQKNMHEIINIGSGRQVTINYLAELFKGKTIHLESRKFEERFKQADIKKAKRLLSYTPLVTIEEGVAKLLKIK